MVVDRTDEMGSHLVANQTDASCNQEQIFIANVADSTLVGLSGNQADKSSVNFSQQHIILSDFSSNHPSAHLSRKETTEVERQNININAEYGRDIDLYMRQLEVQYLTDNSLANHKITANLRARMVDWMIEVLTNFKCEDQTFFLAISLLDRYLKNKREC